MNKIIILLSIFFILMFSISCTSISDKEYKEELKNEQNKSHNESINQNENIIKNNIKIVGINTKAVRIKRKDEIGNIIEERFLPLFTEFIIINEKKDEYIIENQEFGSDWYLTKNKLTAGNGQSEEMVIIGKENIEEFLEFRLSSTYSEGPWDGYSWHQRRINFNNSDKKLSKEKLLSTFWPSINEPGFFVAFFNDDIFKYGTMSGGVRLLGSYKIMEDELVLFNIEEINNTYKDESIFTGKEKIVLELAELNYYYASQGLVNDEIIFTATKSNPERGALVEISGFNCVMLNKAAKLCESTYGYTIPSDDLEDNIYFQGDDKKIFSANNKIEIIAEYKTKELHYYFCEVIYEFDFAGIIEERPLMLWIPAMMISEIE